MRPGGKGAFASIGRQPFPDPDEYVLDELLGLPTVATQAQAARGHAPDVRIVPQCKRCLVAALCRTYRGVDEGLTGIGPGVK